MDMFTDIIDHRKDNMNSFMPKNLKIQANGQVTLKIQVTEMAQRKKIRTI